MTTLIKTMLKKFKHDKTQSNQHNFQHLTHDELEAAEYTLHSVRLCTLAKISHKKKKRLTRDDLEDRIVKKDVLMVNKGNNLYMDIETGNYYELGGLFGEELQYPNKELYVAEEKSLYHDCYDTIKYKNIQPNDKFTASQLRQLYDEHFEYKTQAFWM